MAAWCKFAGIPGLIGYPNTFGTELLILSYFSTYMHVIGGWNYVGCHLELIVQKSHFNPPDTCEDIYIQILGGALLGLY